MTQSIKFEKTLNIPFSEVIEKTTEALKLNGFGVLTNIDFQKTMKEKLGKSYLNYQILGACNPGFADQAMQKTNDVGLFIPCNVTVREHADGSVTVSAVNPVAMLSAIGDSDLTDLASEVGKKLQAAIESV